MIRPIVDDGAGGDRRERAGFKMNTALNYIFLVDRLVLHDTVTVADAFSVHLVDRLGHLTIFLKEKLPF